jgi:hypothetical protein
MQPADSQYRSVGCISNDMDEYIELAVEESKPGRIRFLLDSGADISLIKGSTLIGSTEFDPKQKVKVKSVDGSVVKTHGALVLHIHEAGSVN